MMQLLNIALTLLPTGKSVDVSFFLHDLVSSTFTAGKSKITHYCCNIPIALIFNNNNNINNNNWEFESTFAASAEELVLVDDG